jgi:hypothetical protein
MKQFTEEYKLLNHSFKKKLVYRFGSGAGFFSEYNNMIFTMLYCLRNEIEFELHSSNSNVSKKGWGEYFIPFCNENKQKWHIKYNHSWIIAKPKTLRSLFAHYYYLLLCCINKVDYVTSDLFHIARTQRINESVQIKNLTSNEGFMILCNSLVNMTYRFNNETKAKIQQRIEAIKLNEYVGFHIRRGDKFIEKKFNHLSEYITKAERLTDIRKAFVSTDDFEVIEELQKKYPNWKFFTLTNKEDKGFEYSKYEGMSAIRKQNHLLDFFASVDLLVKSNIFIGTFNSNVGMFVKMHRNQLPTYAVDSNDWIIW